MQRDADNERNRIKISDLEINSKARRVTRDGQTLKLGALTYDLLLTLVDAAPGLVTYETLAERVWRGRAVTPETIAQRAKLLREALSDSARNPRYVELIRGKGYRLIPDPVALAEEPGQQSSVGIRFASVLAILVLVAACAWVYLAPPQEHRSVAVLPFDNLAAPGGPDPVGDAIATEIIVRLASLERLNVASRSESFQHRDPSLPARELGQTLGVSTLVEGSVQQLAGNLRITAQLVDARNGYTLWAAVFNRDKQDLFAVQQDIAESVASALGVKLGVGGVNDFMGAGTRSVEAYEAYLRGNLDGALALDPNYAAAWGGKAIRVASTMFNHLPHEAPEIIAEAQKLSARAVALDPNSAAAHANQATLTYPSMNWDAAEAAYHRSLELRRDVHNLSHYGNMLMRAGRSSAAIEIYNERDALLNRDDHQVPFRILAESALGNRERVAQQARQLGVSSKFYSAMAIALSSGDEATIRETVSRLPKSQPAYSELYGPLTRIWDNSRAAIEFLYALAADDDNSWPAKNEQIALTAAYFGAPDLALETFLNEIRYTTIRFGSLWLPVMADVRALPAFKRFAVDANLVSYWRKHGWSDFCRPLGPEDFTCATSVDWTNGRLGDQ